MSTVGAVDTTSSIVDVGSASEQALNVDDFLKILITELTNQDPFEPMKNQDLLNQVATIQELESSQKMTDTFSNLANQFDGFMGRLDGLMMQQQMSSATGLIGSLVSGYADDGQLAIGKVATVNVNGSDVMLELDTGQKINFNDITRLGAANGQSIVGALVMDKHTGEVGTVSAIEIDDNQAVLHLTSGNEIALEDTAVINADTVDFLIGLFVEGADGLQGHVQSYLVAGDAVGDITLILDTQEQLLLSDVTKIKINNG